MKNLKRIRALRPSFQSYTYFSRILACSLVCKVQVIQKSSKFFFFDFLHSLIELVELYKTVYIKKISDPFFAIKISKKRVFCYIEEKHSIFSSIQFFSLSSLPWKFENMLIGCSVKNCI